MEMGKTAIRPYRRKIASAEKGSPAARAGVRAGEFLVSINGEPVKDLVDYEFLTAGRTITLQLEDGQGEPRELIIHKREAEPLGLNFDVDLLGSMHTCANKCMFCFIDQMPRDVRSSLLVKDDDWRFSFIMGNYCTLTNVSDAELDRIIARKVSPIYISVQTTDPELRCRMLSNRHAGNIMERLKKLADGGLHFHCQIVCCPGINDGESLDRTIDDLYGMWPAAQSVAMIPVGLTRFREGLYPLTAYTKETATKMIARMEAWEQRAVREHGEGFLYLADEWYTTAGLPLPSVESYGDFPQIENGVGLLRLFEDDMRLALSAEEPLETPLHVAVAGGEAAHDFFVEAYRALEPYNIHVDLYAIHNDYFGGNVSVGGLVTGGDLVRQLKGRLETDLLLLPRNMFKEREDVFLDGMTIAEVADALGVTILPFYGGDDFIDVLFTARNGEKR